MIYIFHFNGERLKTAPDPVNQCIWKLRTLRRYTLLWGLQTSSSYLTPNASPGAQVSIHQGFSRVRYKIVAEGGK